jgi:hypothetical protein
MRQPTLALAVLIAGCAAPAASVPREAAASSPAEGELVRLQTEFRSADRELGDLLEASPQPSCDHVHPFQVNLGRIAARICELSGRRDAHSFIPGAPCRYTMERRTKLGQQAQKLGCRRCQGMGELLVAYCS